MSYTRCGGCFSDITSILNYRPIKYFHFLKIFFIFYFKINTSLRWYEMGKRSRMRSEKKKKKKLSARFYGQKTSIVNSVEIYKAQLTKKKVPNQAAFGWWMQRIYVTNLNTNESCMGNFYALTQTPDHMDSYWKYWVSATKFHKEMVSDRTIILHTRLVYVVILSGSTSHWWAELV